MAVPATQPTRPDDTRQALLAAAHDLLAGEGPGALTVRRIAAAAGMSTMNVYSRFGGKDGVLDELFIDGFRRLGERMKADAPTDDPLDDLRRCGECYRDFATQNPTYYSLMFDRVIPDFEPSAVATATGLETLEHLAAKVQRAMDHGSIAAGDAFTIATALWACVHGLAALEARTPADVGVFPWDDVAPLAMDAMVRGLAASPDPLAASSDH